jgi:ferredoxin
MRVWIDQDLCTGDGLCVDHCPDVFVQLEDGIAYVAEAGQALNDPGGSQSLAAVMPRHHHSVIQAAEVCPGECIFIEIDTPEMVRPHPSGVVEAAETVDADTAAA